MAISKELQDFLNDDDVLDLIVAQDWKKLFSKFMFSQTATSTLHEILVNSGIASTDQILLSLGYVPSWFFKGFDDLTSITIPYGVRSIGDWAFSRCSNLTSITIPNSVTIIGYYTFHKCSSLTSITIPNSVTSIGAYAFFDCSSLTSITIPNSVTSIGKDAFWGCDLKTIYFNGTKDQWKQVKKTRGWKGSNTQVKIIFEG